MTNVVGRAVRAGRLAVVLALALAAAGCANTANTTAAIGSAQPGSQQDFVVNVGDRVFFESDSTELTSQSVATLEKQAQWLQAYGQYTFTVEGHADERGTREYNIALGARRSTVRDYLTRAASARSACAPFPTKRRRLQSATTFPAGRRTAAR
jgi:peptidoglycan-associated lipoprotein